MDETTKKAFAAVGAAGGLFLAVVAKRSDAVGAFKRSYRASKMEAQVRRKSVQRLAAMYATTGENEDFWCALKEENDFVEFVKNHRMI